MSKRIVVFYSLTDNTKEAAKIIADGIGADVVRLKTVKDMPKNQGKKFLIGGMQAIIGMKPAIERIDVNFEDYDEIVLGTPIWAGKNAPALNTFLKDNNIRRKVTAVFTFSGGGDNDKCITALKKILPNLRCSVALADRSIELSKENTAKLSSFIEEIMNG